MRISHTHLAQIVGDSTPVRLLREKIQRVAASPLGAPVLVLGPTGSGKELVAHSIHELSSNAREPFVPLNCAAIPETLFEAELFGHDRGAFTGADRSRAGAFATARRGTIFLDEIGDLSLAAQAKLLRVLENRSYRSIGSDEERTFKGRLVAATNANLAYKVANGEFRDDLFYRLHTLPLEVPALAERIEDIPPLVELFVQRLDRLVTFDASAMAWLCQQPWPGNVRELHGALQSAVVFAGGERVGLHDFVQTTARRPPAKALSRARDLDALARELAALPGSLLAKVRHIERVAVDVALERSGRNKSQAARALGLNRRALDRKLKGFSAA